MPTDRQLQAVNRAHRALVRISGGRFGWKMKGMVVLELTTVGRVSGLARTVMLTSPLQDGEVLVVVASRGGGDQHPSWFVNLRENPEVTAAVAGKPERPMLARVATPDERAALWPQVVTNYGGYAGYQKKTEREIPLVFLEPVGR